MTTRKKGATLVGLPDRFVAVEIETESPPAFDAAQYSFFGDLSAADSGLEGALEDGLEAPPPEDGLSQDYGLHAAEEETLPLDEDEDLSVASIFRNQLGLGPAKTPTKRVDPDEDAGLDALLTDPLSIARKQLRDDDYDHRGLPAELYPDTAAITTPGLFGATASPYALFDGRYGGMLGASQANPAVDGASNAGPDAAPPQSQASQSETSDTAAGSALLHMLKKPSQQPMKAMTLEELEARILGSAEPPSAPAADRESGPNGISPDVLAAVGHDQQVQHQQQAAALHTRLLPGTPVSSGGGSGGGACGHAAPGPHVPRGGMLGLPQPPPPPGAFPPHMQPPGPPPGAHGLVLEQGPPVLGPQHQPHLDHHPHMHGSPPPHGPMHMMPPGSLGAGMYPPHAMMGPGHQPQNLMYAGNGMLPPPPHNHPPGPGITPRGLMGPPSYGVGPGGMYSPRGPMPPYGPGPMGMGGPPPYTHDGYPLRPMGPSPGMPGAMHGMPARPGPFGYGPPALGPGRQQHQVPLPGQPRPGLLPGPPPAPAGPGGGQRLGHVLGPGAAGGRPAGQVRQGNGPHAGSDFVQQCSRAVGATAAFGPIALAAAATAASRAGGAPSGPGGRLGGKWMRPDDVEYVVRSMLYTVATGVPYVEDYYYQAFVHKHVSQPSRRQLPPGSFPMAAPFVPEGLRELPEDQMSMMRLDPSARAKFVEGLQGLGKIVLSNIRTPKVLMDLSDRGMKGDEDARARIDSAAEGEGSTDVSKAADQQGRCGAAVRPLEQEPLLAARIMIEDCMNLLLDVDDIDRLANHMAALAQAQQRAAAVAAALPHPGAAPAAVAVAASAPPMGPYGLSAAAPPPAAQLRQRRELLLAGINGAFQLPNTPMGAAATMMSTKGSMDLDTGTGSARAAHGGSLGDGVLLRILALSKGRGVVARALLAIAPPASVIAVSLPKPPSSAVPEKDTKVWAEAATSIMGNGNRSDDVQHDVSSDVPSAVTAVAPLLPGDMAPTSTTSDEAGGGSLLGLDAPSPFSLLWGTLRNSWAVFGTSLQQGLDPATERPLLEATARLAAALREALLRLATPRDVVDAAAAFNVGCQQHVETLCVAQGGGASAAALVASMEAALLPLAQTRAVEAAAEPSVATAPVAWLGEALAALVTRASQLGLAAAACPGGEDTAAGSKSGGGMSLESADETASVSVEWRREYDALQQRLTRHLEALGGIHSMAAASGNAEALAVVRSLSCRLLVNAMLQHASSEQAQQLKAALAALSA